MKNIRTLPQAVLKISHWQDFFIATIAELKKGHNPVTILDGVFRFSDVRTLIRQNFSLFMWPNMWKIPVRNVKFFYFID